MSIPRNPYTASLPVMEGFLFTCPPTLIGYTKLYQAMPVSAIFGYGVGYEVPISGMTGIDNGSCAGRGRVLSRTIAIEVACEWETVLFKFGVE